jgi:hypothetical protein
MKHIKWLFILPILACIAIPFIIVIIGVIITILIDNLFDKDSGNDDRNLFYWND